MDQDSSTNILGVLKNTLKKDKPSKENIEVLKDSFFTDFKPKSDPPSGEKELRRGEKLKNDHTEQKIDLQKDMFAWIKTVVIIWLSFIMIFLWTYTAVNMYLDEPFILHKEIIITLLATTTLNILGLPFVVTKYLFGST